MDWVNQRASITFFSSVYQIYIFLHIKICRCGIFHLNSIHVQIIVFNVLTILTNSKSRLFSEWLLEVNWQEIPPQHSLLHLMQAGLVSALPVQMELVCRVNSGNGHLSLSGGHCQQTTCSPHLTVYEMYQLSWQPRWTQVWFYLLDMKPGSGPIVTTIMEILLRVKPL